MPGRDYDQVGNETAAMQAQMGMEQPENAAYLFSGCVVF